MQGIKNVKIHFKLITHAGYNSYRNSIGKFLSRKAIARKGMCLLFPIWHEGKIQTLREVAGMVLLLLKFAFLKLRSYSYTVLTDAYKQCVSNLGRNA